MTKFWGGILAVTGFIACPCHLPLTLPLLLGVLGGTGVGSFIGANTGLVYGLATAYFIGGIGLGLFLLNRKRAVKAACDVPQPNRTNGHMSKRSMKRERVGVDR